MKFLLRVYSIYGLVIFTLIFLLLLPFFLLTIYIKPWAHRAYYLNHLWARIFFFLMPFNSTKIIFEEKLAPGQTYIFCANHFSYLDIPVIGLIKHDFKFVGKSSLKKIPLFGFMYDKLHILVDRKSLKSKYNSLRQAKKAVKQGFSIVFFPEGGIISKNPPQMTRFKEGSFRLAAEENIPIVPISIPYNHIILPDRFPLTIRGGKVSIKVHRPVWPEGNTDAAISKLKEEVYQLIQSEIDKENV